MTETIYISRIASYCFNVGKNPDELILLKLKGLRILIQSENFRLKSF